MLRIFLILAAGFGLHGCASVGAPCPALAALPQQYLDIPVIASTRAGNCHISAKGNSYWLEYMPEDGRPHFSLSFLIDNSAGGPEKLSWKVLMMDESGASHEVPFSQVDTLCRKSGSWDGTLAAGEMTFVNFKTREAPKLEARGSYRVEVSWTDSLGNSALLRLPKRILGTVQ